MPRYDAIFDVTLQQQKQIINILMKNMEQIQKIETPQASVINLLSNHYNHIERDQEKQLKKSTIEYLEHWMSNKP